MDTAPGPAGPTGPARLEQIPLPSGPITLLRPADPDAVAFDPVPGRDGPAGPDGTDGPAGPDGTGGTGYGAVQELHPPHWARLWPSGRALADAVDRAGSSRLAGRRVVELGCGLGLPSLVAARAGAGPVLATDRSAAAVAWVAANARRAGLRLDTATAAFDTPDDLLGDGRRWDLVLAADVLYGAAAADALTSLLPRLTARRGAVWLADPGRPETPRWLERARELWTVRTRPLPHGIDLHVLRRRP